MSFQRSPAPTDTPAFIEQCYLSAVDSISVIDSLLAKVDKTVVEVAALDRNVKHLEILLAKSFWTTEDLAPLTSAVLRGRQ